MGVSQRRREQRQKRSTLKAAKMKSPGKESVYARKLRGDYPPNSPYVTGYWGQPMRRLRAVVEQREEMEREERARVALLAERQAGRGLRQFNSEERREVGQYI